MTEEPGVQELLADEDAEARRRGAQRLGELRGPHAIGLLVRALGDGDWRVRKEAAAVAPKVAPRALVTEALFGALGEKDNVGLRNAAVEALILVGSDAVPVAMRALAELDADGRKLAVEVLGGVPELVGTNALTRALHDEDVNVRAAAAEALGSASLAGAEAQGLAIVALTGALEADEPLRRLGALRSLTTLEAKLSFKTFEPLTKDPLLRRHAIAAVGRTHEATAVAALARATGDPSLAVARDALVALVDCLATHFGTEELGRIARREIRSCHAAEDRIRRFAVSVDDGEVRGAALVALGLLRVRSDVPELVRGLSDEGVAPQAELGLRWFGHDAVAALLEEGKTSAPSVRAATLSLVPLLTGSADHATLEILRDALGADSVEVKTAALHAIAAAGSGDDLTFVAGHTVSPDPRVAATACAALTHLASRYPASGRATAPVA
jgi:HEAT repeat protein